MSELSLAEVNNVYFDVLKEIGNIGAGNATTAISTMLNLRIDMSVPKRRVRTYRRQGIIPGKSSDHHDVRRVK